MPRPGAGSRCRLVAIVGFRGDKLYHEHIYWDQASVLVQIGLLDPKGLPAAGIDTAKKLLDETRPSNTLMKRWAESAPPNGEGRNRGCGVAVRDQNIRRRSSIGLRRAASVRKRRSPDGSDISTNISIFCSRKRRSPISPRSCPTARRR